jgi:thiol:disulfide interchange protein DsbD
MEYSESPNGVGDSASGVSSILPEGAKKGPHGIVVFDDYEKGWLMPRQ